MARRLRLWAAVLVGVGTFYTFAGSTRVVAPALLIVGLLLAVASLLMDRRERC